MNYQYSFPFLTVFHYLRNFVFHEVPQFFILPDHWEINIKKNEHF